MLVCSCYVHHYDDLPRPFWTYLCSLQRYCSPHALDTVRLLIPWSAVWTTITGIRCLPFYDRLGLLHFGLFRPSHCHRCSLHSPRSVILALLLPSTGCCCPLWPFAIYVWADSADAIVLPFRFPRHYAAVFLLLHCSPVMIWAAVLPCIPHSTVTVDRYVGIRRCCRSSFRRFHYRYLLFWLLTCYWFAWNGYSILFIAIPVLETFVRYCTDKCVVIHYRLFSLPFILQFGVVLVAFLRSSIYIHLIPFFLYYIAVPIALLHLVAFIILHYNDTFIPVRLLMVIHPLLILVIVYRWLPSSVFLLFVWLPGWTDYWWWWLLGSIVCLFTRLGTIYSLFDYLIWLSGYLFGYLGIFFIWSVYWRCILLMVRVLFCGCCSCYWLFVYGDIPLPSVDRYLTVHILVIHSFILTVTRCSSVLCSVITHYCIYYGDWWLRYEFDTDTTCCVLIVQIVPYYLIPLICSVLLDTITGDSILPYCWLLMCGEFFVHFRLGLLLLPCSDCWPTLFITWSWKYFATPWLIVYDFLRDIRYYVRLLLFPSLWLLFIVVRLLFVLTDGRWFVRSFITCSLPLPFRCDLLILLLNYRVWYYAWDYKLLIYSGNHDDGDYHFLLIQHFFGILFIVDWNLVVISIKFFYSILYLRYRFVMIWYGSNCNLLHSCCCAVFGDLFPLLPCITVEFSVLRWPVFDWKYYSTVLFVLFWLRCLPRCHWLMFRDSLVRWLVGLCPVAVG